MRKKYAIGIDLHGTLLNEQWNIDDNLVFQLKTALSSLKTISSLYICTGNDLHFVKEYLPQTISEEFDGYILETGSVHSNGESEQFLVTPEIISQIKIIESNLKSLELPEALFFAYRSASISIFTKDRHLGSNPSKLWENISRLIEDMSLSGQFRVTHSDVAVDIVHKDINKFTSIRAIAAESSIIAIADSFNDLEFLLGADISFIPANSTPKQWKLSPIASKPVIIPISSFRKDNPTANKTKAFYQSSLPYTEGLIDILTTIKPLIFTDR